MVCVPPPPPGARVSPKAAGPLSVLRENRPLVQCVTNAVVTGFTANALLALGAAPAMVDVPGEAGAFAGAAGAILVNLGTPHAEQREAAVEAAAAARAVGTPWVLDPVAVGALPVRTGLAHGLLDQQPSVVRGNASEVLALAGGGTGGRGVDSTAGSEDTVGAAVALAARTGGVVAVSGATDVITDGARIVRVDNGSPLLQQVTGAGCALGAVVAACAAVTPDDVLEATVAAHLVWGVAAEVAAGRADGPGSFAVALLDALDDLDDVVLADRARRR